MLFLIFKCFVSWVGCWLGMNIFTTHPLKLKLIRFPTSALQPFASTLALQEHLVQCKLLDRQNEPDYLIAVQHCPVITLGRRSHTESIEEKSIDIIKCNRGGQVTYHGPGQLTFYPILDLHRHPHLSLEWYVEQLASVMKDTIEQVFNIQNSFYDKCPERVGVWLTPTEKVGFIGIQAQRWIVSHGFSLNVLSSSLNGFKNINPCGLGDKNIKISSCSHHFKDEPLLKETEDFIVKSFINKFTFSLPEQD